MPKSRALRRIDRVPGSGVRNIAITGSAGGTIIESPSHTHDIYTTDGEVNALIAAALSNVGLSVGQWQTNGSSATIDIVNAAADSTLYILNSDATYDANVSIDGDLSVGGTLNVTGSVTFDEITITGAITEYITITPDEFNQAYIYVPNETDTTLYVMNPLAGNADLYVQDDVTIGGLLTVPDINYSNTEFHIDGNSASDTTVFFRNTGAGDSNVSIDGDLTVGGTLNVTGSTTFDEITITGAITEYVTITPDEFNQAYIYVPGASDTTLWITNTLAGNASLYVQDDITLDGNIVLSAGQTVDGVDVSAHAAATEAHGATGAVVGTTNTQTLTNKTLASPTVTGTMTAASATFSGTVGVTGAATFSSTINVTGTGTFVGDVAVGDDLTVTDAATISGLFTAAGDVTLPYWSIDSASGVMQTTGVYAFQEPGATDDYEGIRFTPSLGAIESELISASRLATEVLVFELVTVNAGDLVIAKSGGRLREAASLGGKKYLTDHAGNRIVDESGNYIVLNDAGANKVQFTIKLEDPPVGGQLLEVGDQIQISGRPETTTWSWGSGFPIAVNRFYPAARVSALTSSLPVTLKAVVVSVVPDTKNEYVVTIADNLYYESITFPKGAAVANFGQGGDAYLSLTTRNKKAFMDVGRLPGQNWTNSLTPFIRLGDISGLTNVAEPTDVGLVGGDITNGTDAYFKIAQSGIVLHNGDHVITDSDGVEQVKIGGSGIELRTWYQTDTSFGGVSDPMYQSAITWMDELEDPEKMYASMWAFQSDYYLGGRDTFVNLAGYLGDANRVVVGISARGLPSDNTFFGASGYVTVEQNKWSSGSIIKAVATNFISISGARRTSIGATEQVSISAPAVVFSDLPTSSDDLPIGAIWNDSGTLKVVT